MKAIPPNIWMLLVRAVLLIFFIYVCQWPLEKIGKRDYLDHPVIFWIGFAAIMMLPAYLIWTFLGVMWITTADDKTTMNFHYVFKTVRVAGTDISSYYKTVHKTKACKFEGLIIKLKTGKVIEVTNYNLKSVDRISAFLMQNQIPLRGNIQSWFPYTREI